MKCFDKGIHKYLHERATRNKEAHQLILAEKSVQGKVNVAVSAYHLYGVSPLFCWVESMSCPAFCVNCQVFDSAFRFPLLPLGLESLKLYYNTYSRTPSEVRQFCKNEYFLKLTEKQYREHHEN